MGEEFHLIMSAFGKTMNIYEAEIQLHVLQYAATRFSTLLLIFECDEHNFHNFIYSILNYVYKQKLFCLLHKGFYFAEDIMGLDALWFIGDNFMAETYRKYFRKNDDYHWFVKENFEVTGFCSSKYSDSNSNMLSRIVNSYAYALNEIKLFKLPKFIVVVLDDDLIQYLGFVGKGTTRCYGEWLEYIVKNMLDMTKIRLASLPKKAVKAGYPQLYFVILPHHALFTDNKARTRVTNAMEIVCKEFTEVRIIRMKEIRNYDDKTLVDSHGYLTHQGIQTYWYSVDSAVAFNAKKREWFLAKSICEAHKSDTIRGKKASSEGQGMVNENHSK